MSNRLVILVISTLLLSCSRQHSTTVRIAAAANMQYALTEINKAFQQKNDIKTELIFSSSGKLTAQIIEGAPYDILLSADLKYPNSIYEKGLSQSAPKIYAAGQLVLWSIDQNITFNKLTESAIKHIAIANPKTAPYGKAAIETFKNAGIYELIKEKLVYGESISQVNQFIMSQSADAGITAKSSVLSNQMKEKGHWIDVDEKNYTTISQAALIINNGRTENANTKLFYNFLFSEEAKMILKDFGYSVRE